MKLVISAHTSLFIKFNKNFLACKKNISYLEPREGIRAVAGELVIGTIILIRTLCGAGLITNFETLPYLFHAYWK